MTAKTQITQANIDACERTIGPDGRVFYRVQSESDEFTTYEVRWNAKHKCLTCNCKGGQEGYSCKHMRWSLKAEEEFRAFKKAEREAQARIEATAEYQLEQLQQAMSEANRKMAEFDASTNGTNEAASREAAALSKDGWKAYERKPFSLLK